MSYKIKRDGKLLAEVQTEFDVLRVMHRLSPQSVDWAIRYEGFSVERGGGSEAALDAWAEDGGPCREVVA